ncbi:Abscisic acid G-protein coupled receptor-domain-containing protein, partial [Gorgonomyces haynaldii]
MDNFFYVSYLAGVGFVGSKFIQIVIRQRLSPVVVQLFAGTLGISMLIIFLFIAEVADFMQESWRIFWWGLDIFLILFNSLLVLPLLQLYLFYQSFQRIRKPFVLASVSWIGLLIVFLLIPCEPTETLLGPLLVRSGMVGVFLMASLSGFTAVYTPFQNLQIFRKRRTIEDVQEVEQNIKQTMAYIFEKKRQQAMKQTPQTGYGFLSSFTSNQDTIENEIAAQELILSHFISELDSLHQDMEYQKTREWTNFLGIFFAIYCIYKTIASLFNILLHSNGGSDPATTVLVMLTTWFGFDVDLAFWSKQLSFLLVSIMAISSIRSILLQFTKLSKRGLRTITTETLVLIFSNLIGFYFLSVTLMLRSNLPPSHREKLRQVLGDVEFHFYQRWFDTIFLITTLVSSAILLASNRVNKMS